MVLEHGYHGHTQAGIDISDYKFSNLKGEGQKNHIIKAEIPNEYDSQKSIKTGFSALINSLKLAILFFFIYHFQNLFARN